MAAVSPRTRLALMGLSCALAASLAELLVRAIDGGSLPHLGGLEEGPWGLRLGPSSRQSLRHASGHRYTIQADALGLRAGGEPRGWLVLGDSQVLGMGVEADQTFAARLGLWNSGLPALGLTDQAARAPALVQALRPQGLLLVVNEANDWEEEAPLAQRLHLRGGWLVTPASSQGLSGAFWSSPLSRLHVLYLGAMLTQALSRAQDPPQDPGWLCAPDEERPKSLRLAEAARSLGALGLPLVVALLPADIHASEGRRAASPFAPAADRCAAPALGAPGVLDQLAQAIGRPTVDLRPALRQADHFLDRDYHLSAQGHAAVAQALAPALEAP